MFEAYAHFLPLLDGMSTMGKLQLAKELQFIHTVTEQVGFLSLMENNR